MARPSSIYWPRCCWRMKRRMRERARPVTTKRSQVGDDAGIADLGMDGVGEIDRRRAARQRDQVALRGEAEHLVLEHLELGVLEEFLRSGGMVEDVQELAQPAILLAVHPLAALLVAPMRGNAELGHLVHLAGADLHFDALAL